MKNIDRIRKNISLLLMMINMFVIWVGAYFVYINYVPDVFLVIQIVVSICGLIYGLYFNVASKDPLLSDSDSRIDKVILMIIKITALMLFLLTLGYFGSARQGRSGILIELVEHNLIINSLGFSILCFIAGFLCFCALGKIGREVSEDSESHSPIVTKEHQDLPIIYKILKKLHVPVCILLLLSTIILLIFQCTFTFLIDHDWYMSLLHKFILFLQVISPIGFILFLSSVPKDDGEDTDEKSNKYYSSRLFLIGFVLVVCIYVFHCFLYATKSILGTGNFLPRGTILNELDLSREYFVHESMTFYLIPFLMLYGFLANSEEMINQYLNQSRK